jgi:hypothetical protein
LSQGSQDRCPSYSWIRTRLNAMEMRGDGFTFGHCHADWCPPNGRTGPMLDPASTNTSAFAGAFEVRLRGVEPPRPVRVTRPSTLRVYQFRHSRLRAVDDSRRAWRGGAAGEEVMTPECKCAAENDTVLDAAKRLTEQRRLSRNLGQIAGRISSPGCCWRRLGKANPDSWMEIVPPHAEACDGCAGNKDRPPAEARRTMVRPTGCSPDLQSLLCRIRAGRGGRAGRRPGAPAGPPAQRAGSDLTSYQRGAPDVS